jgi:hypothetical protein
LAISVADVRSLAIAAPPPPRSRVVVGAGASSPSSSACALAAAASTSASVAPSLSTLPLAASAASSSAAPPFVERAAPAGVVERERDWIPGAAIATLASLARFLRRFALAYAACASAADADVAMRVSCACATRYEEPRESCLWGGGRPRGSEWFQKQKERSARGLSLPIRS